MLGDVVVSSPRGNYSGVLQYDKGAWEGLGRLSFRGYTNGVPGNLLAAVNNFRAEGWSRNNIAEVLKQMRGLDEERKQQLITLFSSYPVRLQNNLTLLFG